MTQIDKQQSDKYVKNMTCKHGILTEEEVMSSKRKNNARSAGEDGMVIIEKTVRVGSRQKKKTKKVKQCIKFSVIFRSNLFFILFFFSYVSSPYFFLQTTFVRAAEREATDGQNDGTQYGIHIGSTHRTTLQAITDSINTKMTPNVMVANNNNNNKENKEVPLNEDSTRIQTRSVAPTKPSVNNVKREELTALKALDTLLRSNYDRRSTPTNELGVPTNVSCQLFVASLSSINTDNMDYMTDTYLRQRWTDPRLSHPDIVSPLDLADPKLVKAIWKPEVFFPNAKEANFQFVTVPNVLIRIHPQGEILYILRLRLRFSCMMELSRYPLDTQTCAMQISSFSKTTSELVLNWDEDKRHEEPVTVAKDLRMPQFEMQKITTNRCHERNHMGNYSCLVAEFHLHRSIGFHLIQSFLPSILIVAISWVSFWMDIDCVPARVTLGVITLLTVSSLVTDNSGIPQTSYVKAIDVWMGVCTAFVFAALVEFTIVNYMWRKLVVPDVTTQGGNNKMFPGKRHRRAQTSYNSYCPCIERQNASIELEMVNDEYGSGNPDLHPLKRHSHTCTTNLNNPLNGKCNNTNNSDIMSPNEPSGDAADGGYDETVGNKACSNEPTQLSWLQDGGQKQPGMYKDNECSFATATPDGGDSVHVNMGQIGAGMAFQPLMAIRNQAHYLKVRAVNIDEWCRFLFPAGFVVFNLFYWFYYQVYTVDGGIEELI